MYGDKEIREAEWLDDVDECPFADVFNPGKMPCRFPLQTMKTASLGLLEVMVVRVNAGGDAPPDPPPVGDVMGHSPLLSFLKKNYFGE